MAEPFDPVAGVYDAVRSKEAGQPSHLLLWCADATTLPYPQTTSSDIGLAVTSSTRFPGRSELRPLYGAEGMAGQWSGPNTSLWKI